MQTRYTTKESIIVRYGNVTLGYSVRWRLTEVYEKRVALRTVQPTELIHVVVVVIAGLCGAD